MPAPGDWTMGDPFTGMPWPGVDTTVDTTVNTFVTSALNWVAPRRDPLVLDLDGGGIKTSGINPAAPILFDQDGDGTKTATGWIASGEAIVVRDINGNGKIDSGRELFGDNTILTRGPKAGQTAAHGFEALADLDSNGDGKFDANDAAFASVKLWKDANQDGISQANELFTFADLGVASINVAGTASNVDLGGNNTQTFAGSFTTTSGTNGNAGTAQLAGSLLLANNNFYRQFTDDPALTDAAKALPQMQGSGLVRDLRPALSLGNSQAAALQAKLTQFAQDTTRNQQMADLDAVIQSWGNTSAMQTSGVSGILREETAAKNIAGSACSTRASGQFDYETTVLPQSSTQKPCSPNLRQYGLRCARLAVSRQHQSRCDAGPTQTTEE
ncbi:hypothetical protein [Rhodoferax aquaticus]|uniref:Uncharacterized protein n=1 Tax=Rhodoferax aquaticus TaxID=2527691 RepID=A0A515EU54_9BURK|nr:hypothetical protein [Rhodoferax aquaticus]QDL56148.1 hypothetical protein EXZ61_19385 [Rhodoferax aquaticus]